MKVVFALVALLILEPACQTKSKHHAEAPSVSPGADSTAILAKRPGPEAPRSAADRLVRALYFEHNKKENPFREKKDRSIIDQFFAKPTADLIWKAVQQGPGKTGPMTGNLLFNAPDKGIHKTWVEPAALAGSRAVVYVTYFDDGKPAEIRLDLQQTAGRWRITEIKYPTGILLTKLLSR